MAKKKLLGALPVGFKGKFAGVPFSISVQYDIYGNVSAIVLSQSNYQIIVIDGDSKKIKTLADKFFTYISTNTRETILKTDADFKYFQKNYYSKIKDFVKNISEEVNDYNKKQMPIKKAVKKVAKKVATKKAIIKKAVKKSAPKKAVIKKVVKKTAPKTTILKQTGTSNRVLDEMRKAKKPGKRTSAEGNVYYERRANRSDAGKFLGIGSIKKNVLEDYKRNINDLNDLEINLIILKEAYKENFYTNKSKLPYIKNNAKQINLLIKEKKAHLKELKKLL